MFKNKVILVSVASTPALWLGLWLLVSTVLGLKPSDATNLIFVQFLIATGVGGMLLAVGLGIQADMKARQEAYYASADMAL